MVTMSVTVEPTCLACTRGIRAGAEAVRVGLTAKLIARIILNVLWLGHEQRAMK